MTSSRFLSRAWGVVVALIVILAAIAGPARAAGASPHQPFALSLAQLKHVQWTRREGAPSVIYAMAETKEGFLWMASRDGLFRFDGRSFELMDGDIDRAKYGQPVKITVGHDGAPWIWYPKGWLATYRQGVLHFSRAPDPGGEVATVTQTRDGFVWLGVAQLGQPFLRYRQGRWDRFAPLPDKEMLIDVLESSDGAFWLSYHRSLMRRPPNGAAFERLAVTISESVHLAADKDGAVWMAGPHGGQRLSGPGGRWPELPSRSLHWQGSDLRWLAAAIDADGNLWTRGGQFGRVAGLVQAARGGATALAFEQGDIPQMGSTRPASLFIDRRGNIWYGGPRSLDRFSVPSVVIEPGLARSASYGDALLAASSGAVYVGQRDGAYRVDPGKRPMRLFATTAEVARICEDRDHAIWFVLTDRILRLYHGMRTTFPLPPADTGIYECGSDPGGRFWLTASSNGMYFLDGARWQPFRPAERAAAFEPTLLWRDPRGRPWILTEDNVLARLDGHFVEARTIDTKSGLGDIFTLVPASFGLLIPGKDGAALMTPDGDVRMADSRNMVLRRTSGLVETPQGFTWLFGRDLVRVRTVDLKKVFATPGFVMPQRVFTYEDGLPNQADAQLWHSMVGGGDGRLWLSTIDGVAWVDPAHLPFNPTPPGVVITSLTSGQAVIKDPVTAKLPPGSADVTIAFAAISLSMPERVRVLYRLEGQDRDWVNPGARRQAFYTNLAPGDYRFRVIAANEDGVWNRAGDALAFSIPPTFVQSWPFKLLCALLGLVLVWIAYTLRLRTVAGRIRARMAERIGERERIARELHDTLLQSAQSLTLRFQLAVDDLPARAAARPALLRAIDDADLVIAEGRDRVRDLRPAAQEATIQQLIADIVDRQGFGPKVETRIDVSGSSRTLDPLVLDEVTKIASEAIFNIWRHASARRITIEILYDAAFRVRFADDGRGIAAETAEAGQAAGHFGLSGMRERAQKLRGKLIIARLPEGGTEIIVTVPGAFAYRPSARRLRALFGLKD